MQPRWLLVALVSSLLALPGPAGADSGADGTALVHLTRETGSSMEPCRTQTFVDVFVDDRYGRHEMNVMTHESACALEEDGGLFPYVFARFIFPVRCDVPAPGHYVCSDLHWIGSYDDPERRDIATFAEWAPNGTFTLERVESTVSGTLIERFVLEGNVPQRVTPLR